MKLVIFERDWADEFSPFGFAIMTESELEGFREYYSKPRDWYFGTNEGFDECNGDRLFEACKVIDITQEEADLLTKLFNLHDYSWDYKCRGLFPAMPEEEDE